MTARTEFRSGWLLLLIALTGCGLGVSSLPLYTAGVFFPSLEAEFGWSRTQLSASVLAFTLTLALASPIVGRVVDRYGVKGPAAISASAASLCYFAMARSSLTLPVYYVVHVGIAGLGAAAAPVAYTRLVTAHFTSARGLALGLTLLGPSLAAAFAPSFVSEVVAGRGWRSGYVLLGVLTAATLPMLAILREPGTQPAADPVRLLERPDIPVGPFGVLLTAFSAFALGIGGLIVHFVPMLTDAGLPLTSAARLASMLGFSGLIGRVVAGALADRYFAPFVLTGVATSAALGCIVLASFGIDLALVAACAVGFSLGAEADLMGYVVSRYYPRQVYGRVFGWVYAVFIVGIGLSPMALGMTYSVTQSYVWGLCGSALLLFLSAFLFLRLPGYPDANAVDLKLLGRG